MEGTKTKSSATRPTAMNRGTDSRVYSPMETFRTERRAYLSLPQAATPMDTA
jgi:hypothetical protein